MKNGGHLLNSSKYKIFLHLNITFILHRFFQRMAIFTLYFAICLFGLLIRGYYRVPLVCTEKEYLDKEEKTVRLIIANRMECRCHYTNFLWNKPFVEEDNQTMIKINNDEQEKQAFEPLALVRNLQVSI